VQIAYATIAPNETKRYRTFATNPWIVREESTGARMLVDNAMTIFGQEKPQQSTITAPPLLEWNVSEHQTQGGCLI
jgi:hypothetical protein